MHKYDGTTLSVWLKDMTEVLSHLGVLDSIVRKSLRPKSASADKSMCGA